MSLQNKGRGYKQILCLFIQRYIFQFTWPRHGNNAPRFCRHILGILMGPQSAHFKPVLVCLYNSDWRDQKLTVDTGTETLENVLLVPRQRLRLYNLRIRYRDWDRDFWIVRYDTETETETFEFWDSILRLRPILSKFGTQNQDWINVVCPIFKGWGELGKSKRI